MRNEKHFMELLLTVAGKLRGGLTWDWAQLEFTPWQGTMCNVSANWLVGTCMMQLTRNRCVLLSSVRDRNRVHRFHYQPLKDAYLNCNHHILLHRQLVRRPIFRWQVVTNFNLNHAWSWNIHVVYTIYDGVKLPGHQLAQRRVLLLVWTIFLLQI